MRERAIPTLEERFAHIGPRTFSSDPRPQTTLEDRWTVHERLSEGSPELFRVTDGRGEEYLFTVAADNKQLEALRTQAQAAEAVVHRHLIRCFGQRTIEDKTGFVWEFLPVGTLNQLIDAENTFNLGQVLTVIIPLLEAATALHRAGRVHGAIHPGYVRFDVSGRPVLCSPGDRLADASDDPFDWSFVAPELEECTDAEVLNPSVDVYAVAAIAWRMLTGVLSTIEGLRAPLSFFRSDVPSKVAHGLELALSDHASRRPTAAEFLATVYTWGVPEPLQLHQIADDEVMLKLPNVNDEQKSKKFKVVSTSSQKRQLSAATKKKMRTRVIVGAVSLILAVVVFILNFSSDSLPEASDSAPDSSTTSQHGTIDAEQAVESPQALFDTFARQRTEALGKKDLELVEEYAVEGSEIYTEDREQIESLIESDSTYSGLKMTAVVVESDFEPESTNASVRVRWLMEPYATLDSSGDEVEKTEDSVAEEFLIHLEFTDGGWKMASREEVN